MLDYVREGEAIVVTKLDRLGRSVADLANISKLRWKASLRRKRKALSLDVRSL